MGSEKLYIYLFPKSTRRTRLLGFATSTREGYMPDPTKQRKQEGT